MVYSYRLVAWIPGRRDVIFNVPITRSTVWITAAADFAEVRHPFYPTPFPAVLSIDFRRLRRE